MLFIITFFLIFGWKVTSFLDISAIAAISLTIQYLFLHFSSSSNELKNNKPFIALLSLTIYSSFIVLANKVTDLMPILRAGRSLIMLIASISLYNLYIKRYKKPTETICFHIYLTIFIHSIIMIAMYCSEPFRNFIYSITNSYDYVNHNSPYLTGYRICGLTYGLSQTSVVQNFGFILMPYLLININNLYLKTFMILSFPLIIISSLFGGRSGSFLIILFLPIFIFLKIITTKFIFKNIINVIKYVIIILLSFSTISIIAYKLLPSKFISNTLYQSNEIFEAFKLKGKAFTDVINMYFLPKQLSVLLFGVGNYGRTKYFYLPSDVGWIKSIYAIGIIGTFLMLYPYLWGIYVALKKREFLKGLSFVIFFIFLSTILLNFKELSLLTRNQWTIQAILLAILSDKQRGRSLQ